MPDLSTFNPTTDLPDLDGKTIFITGETAGLGASTALQLARKRASRISKLEW
ncbi:hypothetical protein P170DRAFT_478066 [Aspergillus steynii IBT 23096]|uniref:Uncharacterized protein n=1 Tax=Aspergillus steynii IBT 23096 TaxID=1392250 RepID=A0A2I2G2V3_9EURO|nr:uncharacterized protein P170DRAFT_478066 [Aspergillus steynii IBT 23096]PLB47205.1 hypothetical protein P170DRAFT_478066 [Aspergillus steynii IBT 23096]